MDEKFAPGPERKLTLAVVTPGAASADVVAMIGTSANAMTLCIRVHSCNFRQREVPGVGRSLWSMTRSPRHVERSPSPLSARKDHCTVPLARPLGVLQEHPVPTGAEVVKAQ